MYCTWAVCGYVSSVCKTSFFWLCQLRWFHHSLNTESLKILVHTFVTLHVDYCNSASLKTITDELQRVLNAAACLICTDKYDHSPWSVSTTSLLHWLDIPQQVQYKLAMTVHQCLRNQAQTYVTDYCVPVSDVVGRRHLWSASRHQPTVPRVCCSTFGCCSFASAGPTFSNSLPDNLHNSAVGTEQFRRTLKTHLIAY